MDIFKYRNDPSNYSIPRRVGGEVYYYYFTSADPSVISKIILEKLKLIDLVKFIQ